MEDCGRSLEKAVKEKQKGDRRKANCLLEPALVLVIF